MAQITVDADLAAKLADILEPIIVCDGYGRPIGVFKSEAYRRLVDEALAACPVSEEELRRRKGRMQGRPLKEILADLERRAS